MVGPSREQLLRESQLESQFWHQVRIAAANDPALKEMLDEVKTYYLLKYCKNGGKDGEKIYPGSGRI